MKKVICIVIFLTAVMTGCAQREVKNNPVELPADEIILIQNYVNWADGYQNSGWFIDGTGNVYSFDFGTGDYSVKQHESDEEFMDRLETVREQSEPFASTDIDVLRKIYEEGLEINDSASYDEKSMAFDAGQTAYIFRNPESKKLITCFEMGDCERQLRDAHARKIKKYVKLLLPFH